MATPITETTPNISTPAGTGVLTGFAEAVSQATNLARTKRNALLLGVMAPSQGIAPASDFNSILNNLNKASTTFTEGLTTAATDELARKASEVGQLKSEIVGGFEVLRDSTGKVLASRSLKEGVEPGAISPYQKERGRRIVQSVGELKTLAEDNKGIFGRTAALPVPLAVRSDAFRTYESQLVTLKSSIFSNELTAMREASKTGGAVGNVSDREGDKLENALGALQMYQSPEDHIKQLDKINESINTWYTAMGESLPGGADGSGEGAEGGQKLPPGTVVQSNGKQYRIGDDGESLEPI